MTKQNEKDAKRVPELRFKGFADAWEQRKLGEIADFNPKEDLPLTFEYVDLESVSGTTMIAHRTEQKSSAPSRAQRLARLGDLFYQNVRPYQKNNYLLDKNDHTYVFSTGYTQMRPIINGYFLLTLVQRQNFVDKVLKRCTGTSYPAINSKNLSRIKVLIPSTSVNFHSGILDKADMNRSDTNEAEKIGQLFQSLDKTITLHEEKQRQLEQLKKALLQKMFADETGYPVLRFKGFTITWQQRKLGDLASFSKGSGYSKKDLTSEGIPVILYGRLYTGYETIIKSIDTFSQKEKSSVYSTGRDVIVPASGETAEDIARASVVSKKGVALGSDLNIITPTKNIDPTFLALNISNGTPHKEMAKRAQGKSIVHLHNADLVQIMLKYPSLREQKKVSQQFEKLDALITLHQHKIDNLKLLKRALLQKMFV